MKDDPLCIHAFFARDGSLWACQLMRNHQGDHDLIKVHGNETRREFVERVAGRTEGR